MLTLCIRYTLDPNRAEAFRTYVEDETPVIREAGGRIAGYYLPTDFAGPTNIGYGMIEFASLVGAVALVAATVDVPLGGRSRSDADAPLAFWLTAASFFAAAIGDGCRPVRTVSPR